MMKKFILSAIFSCACFANIESMDKKIETTEKKKPTVSVEGNSNSNSNSNSNTDNPNKNDGIDGIKKLVANAEENKPSNPYLDITTFEQMKEAYENGISRNSESQMIQTCGFPPPNENKLNDESYEKKSMNAINNAMNNIKINIDMNYLINNNGFNDMINNQTNNT